MNILLNPKEIKFISRSSKASKVLKMIASLLYHLYRDGVIGNLLLFIFSVV